MVRRACYVVESPKLFSQVIQLLVEWITKGIQLLKNGSQRESLYSLAEDLCMIDVEVRDLCIIDVEVSQ